MGTNLFVGSLAYGVTDEELNELFAACGDIESVQVIKDKFTGQSKGFAFVKMATEEGARQAIEQLNGKEIQGRAIVVNEARPKEEGHSGGRSGGSRGGFGGNGGNRGGYGGGNSGGNWQRSRSY